MKENENYLIYLFDKSVNCKTHEEAREIFEKIELFMRENNCSRKNRSNIFNLVVYHIQLVVLNNLDATFQIIMSSKNDLKVEIIYKDREEEFIKTLKKYNDFCRENSDEEIATFGKEIGKILRNNLREGKKMNLSDKEINKLSDNAYSLTFTLRKYYKPAIKNYICLTEYTEDNKGIKVTYKVGNPI